MSRRTFVPSTFLRDNAAAAAAAATPLLLLASSYVALEFRPRRFFTLRAWRCNTGIAVASNPANPESLIGAVGCAHDSLVSLFVIKRIHHSRGGTGEANLLACLTR